MSANKTKIGASIFVWLLGGIFSLFALAVIAPVSMMELGYIPLYALAVVYIPITTTSIMFAHTLLTELPKLKRFKL